MQFNRTALALACAASLAIPATAQAAPRHHHHRHLVAMIRFPAVKAPKAIEAIVAPGPMMLGMGDVYTLGCQNLPLQGDSLIRIVVGSTDAPDQSLACAQTAAQAGYKVLVTVQYGNLASIASDQAWFRQVVGAYAPYAYAIGAGNEQELATSDGGIDSAKQYSSVWKAVEPIVAQLAPRAIRVAGETSPWGDSFMTAAAKAGLPGAEVFASHVYPDNADPQAVTIRFARLAQQHGAQAWATEGMCGPGAWMHYGCQTETALRQDGFSAGFEWYATSGGNVSAPDDKSSTL
jgi:hypothetical protein